MQVRSKPDVKAVFDRLTAKELPGRRGLEAWRSLLRAHATLMRQLDTDLEKKTGLALADFDVLAQLALAGGELRMTDLAARALISRSGMTRRVARLVDEGLVRRADTDADGRGVVVMLTNAGVARFTDATPVHPGVRLVLLSRLLDHSRLLALPPSSTRSRRHRRHRHGLDRFRGPSTLAPTSSTSAGERKGNAPGGRPCPFGNRCAFDPFVVRLARNTSRISRGRGPRYPLRICGGVHHCRRLLERVSAMASLPSLRRTLAG